MPVRVIKKPRPAQPTRTETIVLLELLAGRKKSDAARAAGVSPQRVSEMLTRAHFVEALQHSQSALLDRATSDLARLVTKAMGTVAETLQADEAALRFRAATFILDRMLPIAQLRGASLNAAPHCGESDDVDVSANAMSPWDVSSTVKAALHGLERDDSGEAEQE